MVTHSDGDMVEHHESAAASCHIPSFLFTLFEGLWYPSCHAMKTKHVMLR